MLVGFATKLKLFGDGPPNGGTGAERCRHPGDQGDDKQDEEDTAEEPLRQCSGLWRLSTPSS